MWNLWFLPVYVYTANLGAELQLFLAACFLRCPFWLPKGWCWQSPTCANAVPHITPTDNAMHPFVWAFIPEYPLGDAVPKVGLSLIRTFSRWISPCHWLLVRHMRKELWCISRSVCATQYRLPLHGHSLAGWPIGCKIGLDV